VVFDRYYRGCSPLDYARTGLGATTFTAALFATPTIGAQAPTAFATAIQFTAIICSSIQLLSPFLGHQRVVQSLEGWNLTRLLETKQTGTFSICLQDNDKRKYLCVTKACGDLLLMQLK
jgi:hypothetical protein